MSKKGSTWKTHKYIRIENGKYIYSEGSKSASGKSSFSYGQGTSKSRAATVNEIHEFLKKFKVTKGKGKSSSSSKSSKGSGSKKESTGSKGSSSKEKSEKASSSSKSEVSETKSSEPKTEEKKTKKVDDSYTEILEKMSKEDKTELPKVRKKQPELEKKKRMRHEDMDTKIYTSLDDQPSIDDLFIQHYGVKGMRWRHRKGPKLVARKGDRFKYRNAYIKRKELKKQEQFSQAYSKAKTQEERDALMVAFLNSQEREANGRGEFFRKGSKVYADYYWEDQGRRSSKNRKRIK